MADKRIDKLAKILIGHSLKVKKGETVLIVASSEAAKPLVLEVYREVLKAGGHPLTSIGCEETTNIFFEHATTAQIKKFPDTKLHEAENIDCFVNIRAPLNKKSLSNIDPAKSAMRSRVLSKISGVIVNEKRWVLVNYPTNALAQEADMSLTEYEDFLYKATNADWKAVEEREKGLKRVFDKGKVVRIVGKETDLTLSIKGRKTIPCFGERNIPDGEVFLSPVEDSAVGHIYYEMPAIYQGREVTGVRLEFKKGKVVKESADKNEEYLKAVLNTDPGARFLGELGIGVN
ncbi:MAG: aminopeptidase, partial [bacterium]|nr:aminopeptidase [bacterium]